MIAAMLSDLRRETAPAVGVKWHPYADIFPWIEAEALNAFRDDVRQRGVLEPIVFLGDAILDGRNRYTVARELRIEYPAVDYLGDDPLGFVIAKNLTRRHLTESQRAMVASRLSKMRQGARTDIEPRANLHEVSAATAAGMLNVSERSVKSARVVHDSGAPALVAAVERGEVSVSAAADVASLPVEEQLAALAKENPKALLDAAKEVRTARADAKRSARTTLLNDLSNKNAPLPERRYPIIYADPPWQYDFSPSNDRSVENHYPTMPIEDICAMQVADICTDDAMLFLWAPPSFIQKGLRVLDAWGFELASSSVWVKTDGIGTGIYFRQRHEYLLLGKRGQPITPRPGSQPDSVIEAARGKHSEKPTRAYENIEQMYPGLAKIELFSRSPREGWDAWGNQAAQAEAA